MSTRIAIFLLTAWLWMGLSPVRAANQTEEALRKADVKRGICVVLGDRDGRLAIELAQCSELTVYLPLTDAEEVAATSESAYEAGLYGSRVFVEKLPPGRIGLADNLADAVVFARTTTAVPDAEVLRVLRPQGKAVSLTGDKLLIKPLPAGVDEWSHHYHSPDNNPQSLDKLARAPYLTQYIAEPRYAPAPQAAVASGGRLFAAFGHVAWHEREERVLNTLFAFNAFNGTTLWTRPLVPGIMVDRSTMIATPQTLYLADDQSCKLLDAATGQLQGEIAPPAALTGGTFWKWMALEGGMLYALIGEAEPPDPDAKWKMTNHGWPWDRISQGHNDRDFRWGFAKTLLAIDPKTKQVVWTHREDPPMDSRALALRDGRIYVASFGRYLACLDAKTGREIWRRTADKDPEVFKAIGPYRPGHGYIGGWKTTVYLKCTDKALYVLGPQVEWLTALSTEDGHVLFKHSAKDLHIVVRDEGLYTIGPQNSTDQTKKLDPLTGRELGEFKTFRRACTRSTGTPDGIFFRGHEGSGRFDVATGQVQWVSAMRPSCHVGVVIAFGQLYWLPWACDCNLQMFGAISLAPAGNFAFDRPAIEAERLEKGAVVEPSRFAASPNDWPTYRADAARSARTESAIPEEVRLLWTFEPQTATELTSPVAVGRQVFVAGLDGIVRALYEQCGQVKWEAYTGGAVRYPPTIADGRVLVGSSDGWAYAFDAETGSLLWRFRAAPADRKIPVHGTLISTWPVAGGVLVDRGVAYFAAGMNDSDGTHVYALDAATGKIRWQNNSCGHLDAWGHRGVTCQGEMLLHDGVLYLAGGNTVSPGRFDIRTGQCVNTPLTGMGSHAPRGRELRLEKGQVKVSGQPLYSSPSSPVYDASVQWTPAVVHAPNGDLTCQSVKAAAGEKWQLVAKDKQGRPLWSQPLPAEPVRWAVAVNGKGQILVTLRGGRVLCFAKAG